MNIFQIILTRPLANGLILFYRLFGGNLGVAIILFTVVLRFVLNPLTKPYMDSMKKMKDLAPSIEKLKRKYGKDKIKFAQAQSELYKQNKINPAAGCLPYLLQLIVLIAFFNVFSRTLTSGDVVKNFNQLLYKPLIISESEKINTRFLYLDVTKPDTFKIPGVTFNFPGPILLLSAFVQLLSSLVMIPYTKTEESVAKKTKGQEDDMQVAMQKSMVYMFPLLTIVIGLKFPSGLALYWFVFSLFQFYQQYRSQGLGGLTPFIKKLNLLKL